MSPEDPAKGPGQHPTTDSKPANGTASSKAAARIGANMLLLLGGAIMVGALIIVVVVSGAIIREGGLPSLLLFGITGGLLVRVASPDRFPEGGKGWLVAILLGMAGFVVGLLVGHDVLEYLHIGSPILAFVVGVIVTLVGAQHVGEMLE